MTLLGHFFTVCDHQGPFYQKEMVHEWLDPGNKYLTLTL